MLHGAAEAFARGPALYLELIRRTPAERL